jgi:arylsulfatase A-like enzyme
MNAIVLVVDRLHAGYVGAYGNTWIGTPSLDRLAVESAVFDQCLIESPSLADLCRAYWQGRHPLGGAAAPAASPSLPSLLRAAGVSTTLLTDEPAVARHPLAAAFDSVVPIELPESFRVADETGQTHLVTCFARIIEDLERAREPLLLWCHLKGMGGPWDAPMELRLSYAEEGDPDPPDTAEVPCQMLEEDFDPDFLLGISQAYAGQVALVDTCVGALVDFLDGSPLRASTLVALISARGFPLGEHRRVGDYDGSLYGELVHVPLWMRFPDSLGEAFRSDALVHPADLCPTLLDWWGVGQRPETPGAASLLPLIREEAPWRRDRLCLVDGDAERAIRTPAWYLRDAGEPELPELFVKPDDRWEVNDVADRCEEVAELLRKAFSECETLLQSGNLEDLGPLDEILLTGLA